MAFMEVPHHPEKNSDRAEDSPIARLVVERGATMPRGDLLALAAEAERRQAEGRPSIEILEEMREDRV
jgi:hypothetical protein